jgi:hypothetical protein
MLTYAGLFDVLHDGLKSLRRFPAVGEYYKTKEWWNITFDCGGLEHNSLYYKAGLFLLAVSKIDTINTDQTWQSAFQHPDSIRSVDPDPPNPGGQKH